MLPEQPTPRTLPKTPRTPAPVKTLAPHSVTKLNEEKANDLKCITEAVQEGLREEAFQQRERKRRANNIVIHGLKENTSTGDAVMIQNLMDTIEVTYTPKYIDSSEI